MKRYLILVPILLVLIVFLMFSSLLDSRATSQEAQLSIYDFTMKALDGTPIEFSRYRGKYMLLVNTASKCGYTYQYADLEKLHEKYGDKLSVLGFPANNFLWQEPGSNDEIASFCQENYGVKFQMFEKISVKGRDKAPLYKWLQARTGESPSWNFCKYLVDPQGQVLGFYSAKVGPLDDKIVNAIR